MIGLDTNVLLRAFVIDDGAQTQAALRFVERACSQAEPGYVNCVVLAETIWVLENTYSYGRDAIAHVIAQLLDADEIRVQEREAVAAVLRHYPGLGVNFADLLIAEINRRAGCSATATFDRKAAQKLPVFALVR